MANDDSSWDFDDRFERDVDREPTHARPPRSSERPPLDSRGTLRTQFERPPLPMRPRDEPGREDFLERYDTLDEYYDYDVPRSRR